MVLVGFKVGDTSKLYIVKDRWYLKSQSTRFQEHQLYEVAHAAGPLIGLVKLEDHQEVCVLIIGDKSMVKHRYVTSNVGQPITQCESVFELLCLMYDLVVTHKTMCERDVLHRDISLRNVLRNMEEGEVTNEHIGYILNLEKPGSFALLTDLDNGAQISKMAQKEPEGRRTGTPIFIALEVAGARPINGRPSSSPFWNHLVGLEEKTGGINNVAPAQFFEDLDKILDVYEREHSFPRLSRGHNAQPVATQTNPPDTEPKRVVHEPRHDVESMFWVLCLVLARANPEKQASQFQKPTKAYDKFCRDMILETDPSFLRQHRGSYLMETEETWREILHPDLRDAASLLHHMGTYLAIRTFDAKRGSWGKYHAHDTFRVPLYSTIQKFRDNCVRLCTHLPRYATPPFSGRTEKGNTPIHSGIATGSSFKAETTSQAGATGSQGHSYATRYKESGTNNKRLREDDPYEAEEGLGVRSDSSSGDDHDPGRSAKRPRIDHHISPAAVPNEVALHPPTQGTALENMGMQADSTMASYLWFGFTAHWDGKCSRHPDASLEEVSSINAEVA